MKTALVAVLGVSLAIAATVAVEESRIRHIAQEKDAQVLLAEWQAAHFAIHFASGHPYWFVDGTNQVDVDWTKRIRPLLVISRSDGRILERSPLYRSLGFPIPPAAGSRPRVWTIGDKYIFCTGFLQEPDGNTYQLTIGKRL